MIDLFFIKSNSAIYIITCIWMDTAVYYLSAKRIDLVCTGYWDSVKTWLNQRIDRLMHTSTNFMES